MQRRQQTRLLRAQLLSPQKFIAMKEIGQLILGRAAGFRRLPVRQFGRVPMIFDSRAPPALRGPLHATCFSQKRRAAQGLLSTAQR